MKLLPFIVLCGLLSSALSAQTAFESAASDWSEKPVLRQLLPAEKTTPELILADKRYVEYFYDGDNLKYSSYIHKIIYVGTKDAIDRNNKIYLPLSSDARIVREKARVIRPDGTSWVLNSKDVKEGVDDESHTPYRYFAVERLEPGCELEYIIEIVEAADYYGREIILQSSVKRKNLEFKLVTPPNLLFAVKSYNGLPEPAYDTLPNGKNCWRISVDTVSGVTEERFTMYESNLARVHFKLEKNKVTGKKNLVNYIEASKRIYELTHEELSKASAKALKKLINDMDLNDKEPEEKKIRRVEDYIKTNFSWEDNSRLPGDIVSVIKNKTALKRDLVKLFVMVYEQLGINVEVVLTSNRYEQRLDPKFESYSFLDAYLLYFPGIKKYLAPNALFFRMDLLPSGYINNYGLFVSALEMGDVRTGVGEVRFIPPNHYLNTVHDMFVNVDFSRSLSDPDFQYRIEFTGYYAQSFQPVYGFLDPARQKEMIDDLLKNFVDGGNFSKTRVENMTSEAFMLKPMVVHTNLKAPQLVETAGSKYLLKIGLLIGPQAEMYAERARVFDVENDFNRSYHREILVNIPEGYRVSNPESLNMSELLLLNAKESSGFVSRAELVSPRQLKVVVDEYYKDISYPRSDYESYRRVINAAADFNKLTLLLEKI